MFYVKIKSEYKLFKNQAERTSEMRNKIIILVAFFALFYAKNIFAESSFAKATEDKPIGDFFDGKKITYNVKMDILSVDYNSDINIEFKKTNTDRYKITLNVKRKKISYQVVAKGFIKNNQLYPMVLIEDTEVLSLEYHTTHWYNYHMDNSVTVQAESTSPATGYSSKEWTFKNKKPMDILSGVFEQIYNLHYGYKLEVFDMVRSDYVLWGVEFKKEKCGNDTCIKFKDEKQEEDFNLPGFTAKLNKDGWPVLITVDKTWIIKDIEMTLVSSE